jgi:integrase
MPRETKPKHPAQIFTDAFIKSLKPEGQRYTVRENAPRGEGGFCIRVTPNGQKSWYYAFFHIDRKGLGWCHLGDYPVMGLSRAREEFRKMRELVSRGIDPIVAKQEQLKERRDAWTVDKLCDEFLEKYAAIKKRPSSAHEDKLNLDRDVRPAWGKRKARDIRRGDVVSLLDDIIARGASVQANRTLATIRKMFAWALEREVVEFNPASGISKPATEAPKERTLSLDEIRTVWLGLDSATDVPEGVKKALRLVLLTGCRPGEILTAQWHWLDGNWIDLSSMNTSNKKHYRIYLSTLAKEVVGKTGEGLILTKDSGAAIPEYALSFWVRSRGYFGAAPWTPHDLRRTCNTLLSKAGVPPHIRKRILNHTLVDITDTVYDQHTYGPEIARALEKWGQTMRQIVSGATRTAKVVNLPI